MVGILRRFVKNVKVYIIRTAVYHSGFRYSIVVWVVGIDDALFHDTERELQRYGPRLGYGRRGLEPELLRLGLLTRVQPQRAQHRDENEKSLHNRIKMKG